jgi:hypothetical protein
MVPVAMAVFLVALVACGDDSTSSAPAGGLNTPDIQATVEALALSQAQALTATPVPASARQGLKDFATEHEATLAAWDNFYQGIDQWREGVVSCQPASVGSALENFSGQSLGITQSARNISRLPNLEILAARLSAAADLESAAFETLSNNWTSEVGLDGSSGLFQDLASARSAADLERGSISRALLARQSSVDEASRNLIEVVSSQLETIYLDWDQFHRAYDSFRETPLVEPEDGATPPALLGGLLNQFGGIVDQIRKLPNTSLTREIARRLGDAADGEQLLLRRLLTPDGSLTETVVVLPEDLVITETVNGDGSTNGNGGADLNGLALNGATVFDVLDTHITAVNQLRRALRIELDDARGSLGEAGQTDVSVLLLETRKLGLDWDRFHDGYDEWRRTNGGCDQGQALDALGELAGEFSQTVRDIQALPSGPLVRGMGEFCCRPLNGSRRRFCPCVRPGAPWTPAPLAGTQQTGHSPKSYAGRQPWTYKTCLSARGSHRAVSKGRTDIRVPVGAGF